MFLYAQPNILMHFNMLETYGFDKVLLFLQFATGLANLLLLDCATQEGPPGLVIDNIPIGQHVAKYRLKHDLSRGRSACVAD